MKSLVASFVVVGFLAFLPQSADAACFGGLSGVPLTAFQTITFEQSVRTGLLGRTVISRPRRRIRTEFVQSAPAILSAPTVLQSAPAILQSAPAVLSGYGYSSFGMQSVSSMDAEISALSRRLQLLQCVRGCLNQ